jgi:hypothetical protein
LFGLDEVRHDKSVTWLTSRIPDSWRRRDADRRPALQRGHGVLSPTQASQSFRPIEAVTVICKGTGIALTLIIGEQDFSRIALGSCHEDDALPTLGHTSEARIDQPVGPLVAKLLKFVHEESHCGSTF